MVGFSPEVVPAGRAPVWQRCLAYDGGMRRLILAVAILFAPPAQAGLSEFRLGVMAHDVGVFGVNKEDGTDGNIEFLFDSPDVLRPLWAPRPHVGMSVNSLGDTSQAYAGLSWSWMPAERWFVEFSLGGAIHDGKLSTADLDRKSLGTRVLFRESLSLGFNIDENHSVMVTLDHVSNANLGEHNEGLDTFGLRWGYRF